MSKHIALLWLSIIAASCTAPKNTQSGQPLRIAFYNVENLFDLQDDPLTLDEDFTPTGKQAWTQDRYNTKLERINEVAKALAYPALFGLCEVENRTVLDDLVKTGGMAENNYRIAHFESPDRRGIDVALLYKPDLFKVNGERYVRIPFPDSLTPKEPGYTSRDILVVDGQLGKKTRVFVMVVHFPSRSGGTAESEPKRLHTAAYLKREVDELAKRHPEARFVIMGDFNDETTDQSVAQVIGAAPVPDHPVPSRLYNCFARLDEQGLGSYNFRGDWNMLDQILLSGHFFQQNEGPEFSKAHIFKEEFLLYKDDKYGQLPNRTYGGTRYFGGYSDHLPVFVELVGK